MSSTWNRMKRILGAALPTSVAVLAISTGAAQAAPITFEGSDTLTDVIRAAIPLSGANLYYNNIGSGQAEKNMIGTGNFVQGIGPMSRNFVQSVLDGHPTWAPTATNVLCLDAGVVVVNKLNSSTKNCSNFDMPLLNTSDPTTAQITTDFSVVLSGYPSGGAGTKSKATTSECASPQRLAALDRLTGLLGVSRINHIYRRDDKSGTQDTFREHLQFDRWCNGKSEGNNNAVGSNLQNQDLDPIRRPCIGADPNTKAATACTYYPLKTQCAAGAADLTDPTYGTIKCSQGLIVALSENDPDPQPGNPNQTLDITKSIGRRVGLDSSGQTLGLVGLAAIDLPDNSTFGTAVNTVSHSDNNVRKGQYMFARRLFLQRNPAGTGNSDRDLQEGNFFTWATNRENMAPLCTNAGFLPPLADPTTTCVATENAGNITCLGASAGVGTPKQNIGAETTACDSAYPCVANGLTLSAGHCGDSASANCPAIPALGSGFECNMSSAGHVGPKCTGGTCTLDSTNLAGTCN